MPGIIDEKTKEYKNGTLEDLLFNAICISNEHYECISSFFNCLTKKNKSKFKRLHKNFLHVYLSSTNDYIGLKIGEAANKGAWDLNSEMFNNIKAMINDL